MCHRNGRDGLKSRERELGELHKLAEARVDEMRTSRVATLNMMQDAVEARNALEEANRRLTAEMAERKRAQEEQRLLLDELTRSNTELEQFAYIASHDLQEPLRMISSYTQLLARRYKDKLDADANEFIKFAVDGAARMQMLINSLLTYSRAGRKVLSFTDVSLHFVVGQAIVNLKTAIDESGAMIVLDDLPVISGDETQLLQLFQNLIGNSIKFRGDEAPEIHIWAKEEKSRWVICVADNGIGIDPQYFERVFVIFQRLNPREKFGGAGMGLAICKKIVERHGGKIWVESSPGKGASLLFSIPKAREEENV